MPDTHHICSAPIAIVGHGYTLPGVSSSQAMAEALLQGKRTYELFPPERISREIYLDAAAQVGMPKIYTALGGSISHRDEHRDEREAPPVPRVHRLVLDAVQRALDSAKVARSTLRGQPVPIFLAHSRGGGHGLYDAAVMSIAQQLLPYLVHSAHPHEFTAAELCAVVDQVRGQLRESFAPDFIPDPRHRAVHRLASIIAETLGTTDKALTVDGNCTGGLIALELAQKEIARGAPWAIAGALSYVDTVNQVLYANSRLLSKKGCYPFAERGDGTVISDGVVMLVLTSLERARDDGLPVLGVVRGVAGGNDGAVERYMLTPHPRGHELAVARAQDRARVGPTEPGVFLSHGSGTRAGDTVEATVFSRALQRGRHGARPPSPVPVLSIKGNVGHTKEAAGLANLVALLAMFDSERIAGPVHDEEIRKHLAFDGVIELKHTAAPWPAGDHPRIGGVSAIASGGQSYHAVVEDAPSPSRLAALLPPAQTRRTEWRDEPIAIVGVAGELPDAPDLRAFWANLLAGQQSFRRGAWEGYAAPLELPPERFTKQAARYGERPADILRYDPLHFLLVDLALAAAARSDIRAGSNVSVVISAEHCSEYGLRQVAAARLPELEDQLMRAMLATRKDRKEVARTVRGAMKRLAQDLPELWAGSLFNLAPSFMAVRIARAFDLTGPTCAVEGGAAASSIGGLEVACHRLAEHEVDAAFWATADMRLGPMRALDESATGHLSRSSTPTALDRRADGYLPGEGATVCLLRRLSDARQRGDQVYGVIRSIGSAFAPLPGSMLADQGAMGQAIERAYARCDVAADALAFVECFGSGHGPSDAAEVAALKGTLGAARAKPLLIGGVMPNIGHTGAAAGAASLVKALFALSAQTLPATVGVRTPLAGTHDNLHIVAANTALPGAQFAGVNAAGAGGTHYHVVLERGTHALEPGA
jgi:acyl transferase domain-containing protein